MSTTNWVVTVEDFFQSQLAARAPTDHEAELISAAAGRASRALASIGALDSDADAVAVQSSCRASDAFGIAQLLLNSWCDAFEESFFVDLSDDREIHETRDYIEEHPVVLASAFGGPLAMLARWSMTAHETMLPLARDAHVLINCPMVNQVADDLAIERQVVYNTVVHEAMTTHLLVSEQDYFDLARRLWIHVLSNDGVDQDLLLGTAVRPNPASTSWDDQSVVVDPAAMVEAFFSPARRRRAANLARLTSRAAAAVRAVRDQQSELIPQPADDAVRVALDARRRKPGDMDLYLQASLGTSVAGDPWRSDLPMARLVLDRDGWQGLVTHLGEAA